MVTFRRILKYTPAVLIGLLALAWVVSVFVAYYGFAVGPVTTFGATGQVRVILDRSKQRPFQWVGECHYWEIEHRYVLGELRSFNSPFGRSWLLDVPFILIVTSILPLAVGPFVSFRFRLWHYLAYTAIVAVELAYYLHWQG